MNSLQPSAAGRPPSQSRSFSDILKGASSSISPKPPSLFRGKPAVSFTEDDIKKYAEPFHFTLIGKFSTGRPPMESLRKSFQSIGFSGPFSLGLIDSRHILIRFDRQDDYLRCWKRGYWTLEGFLMRVIKWHPNFSVDNESPLVPVWINLPLLPIHLYNKEALFSIAQLIGDPLKIDAATEALSRPSQARVCIELDLMKDRCDEVHISLGSFSYWQKITYENVPYYCSSCFKIGHLKESCRKEESRKASAATHSAPLITQEHPRNTSRKEYRPIQRATDVAGLSASHQEEVKDSVPTTTEATPEVPVQPIEHPFQQNATDAGPSTSLQEVLKDSVPSSAEATLLVPANQTTPDAPIPQILSTIPEIFDNPLPTTGAVPTLHASALPTSVHNLAQPTEESASSKPSDNDPETVPSPESIETHTVKKTQQTDFSDNHIQAKDIEDIFKLGEIPTADRPYSSDIDELVTHEKDTFTDLPSSSIAPVPRAKNKKKHSQMQPDRITTRSTRASSQSFP